MARNIVSLFFLGGALALKVAMESSYEEQKRWMEHLKTVFKPPFVCGGPDLVSRFKAHGLKVNSVERAGFSDSYEVDGVIEDGNDKVDGPFLEVKLLMSENICDNKLDTTQERELCKDIVYEQEFLVLQFYMRLPWIANVLYLNMHTNITGKELQHLIGVSASDIMKSALKFVFNDIGVKQVTLFDESTATCRGPIQRFSDLELHKTTARYLNAALGKPKLSFYQSFGFYPAGESGYDVWSSKWNDDSQKNFQTLYSEIYSHSSEEIIDDSRKIQLIDDGGFGITFGFDQHLSTITNIREKHCTDLNFKECIDQFQNQINAAVPIGIFKGSEGCEHEMSLMNAMKGVFMLLKLLEPNEITSDRLLQAMEAIFDYDQTDNEWKFKANLGIIDSRDLVLSAADWRANEEQKRWEEHLGTVFKPFVFGEKDLVSLFKADGLKVDSVEKAEFSGTYKVDGASVQVKLLMSENICSKFDDKHKQKLCQESLHDHEFLVLEFWFCSPWIAKVSYFNSYTNITGKELQDLIGVSASDVMKSALKFVFKHIGVEKVELDDGSTATCRGPIQRHSESALHQTTARYLNAALGKPKLSFYQSFGFYPAGESGYDVWNRKWNDDSQQNFQTFYSEIYSQSSQKIIDDSRKIQLIDYDGTTFDHHLSTITKTREKHCATLNFKDCIGQFHKQINAAGIFEGSEGCELEMSLMNAMERVYELLKLVERHHITSRKLLQAMEAIFDYDPTDKIKWKFKANLGIIDSRSLVLPAKDCFQPIKNRILVPDYVWL